MSNKIPLPSLSTNGWCFSSEKIADYLFSHFFLSDFSQTQIYKDNVSSFSYVIRENSADIRGTCSKLSSVLDSYFSHYFTDVHVEVREVPDNITPSSAEISIYVDFKDSEENTYSLGRILKMNNSIIEKVIKINNYG
jgi:hypothetical protein